jgi:hypothetical protein
MKALFILPPAECDYGTWRLPAWQLSRIPPLSLIALLSHLHAHKHTVKLIDCRELIWRYRTDHILPIISEIIADFRPDLVGVNILTATFDQAQFIATSIKQSFPQIPLIAGGPHPSVEPHNTFMRIEALDAICVGAGEEVCLDILEKRTLNDIPGLLLRDGDHVFEQRVPMTDIDRYPFPNYELVEHKWYSDYSGGYTTFNWLTKSLSALTSRSCPYSCKFCASDWSKPFRYHSAEYVVEMARYLAKFDIHALAFWDDTIAFNKNRLMAICEGFIASRLFLPHGRLRWMASLRANQVEPEVLRAMKAAGCFRICIGVESASDRVLAIIDKKSTVAMNQQAIAWIRESGIDPAPSFMIGIPGEADEEICETLKFMAELNVNSLGFGNFRPLPGSPFYHEFVQQGNIDPSTINWSNLGNFAAKPEHIFCNVTREKLHAYIDTGNRLAYADKYTMVHQDIANEAQSIIEDIRRYSKVCIVPEERHVGISSPLRASLLNQGVQHKSGGLK